MRETPPMAFRALIRRLSTTLRYDVHKSNIADFSIMARGFAACSSEALRQTGPSWSSGRGCAPTWGREASA
jgi:hypothetical protein